MKPNYLYQLAAIFSFVLIGTVSKSQCLELAPGTFSLEVPVAADQGKIFNKFLLEGLSQGKYLGYSANDYTIALLYGDVVTTKKELKELKRASVEAIRTRFFFDAENWTMHIGQWGPVRPSNEETVKYPDNYTCMDHLGSSLAKEKENAKVLGDFITQSRDNLFRTINLTGEEEMLLPDGWIGVSLSVENYSDTLSGYPLRRLVNEIMEGIRHGVYLAYSKVSSSDPSDWITFEQALIAFFNIEDLTRDEEDYTFLWRQVNEVNFYYKMSDVPNELLENSFAPVKVKAWKASEFRIGLRTEKGEFFFIPDEIKKEISELCLYQQYAMGRIWKQLHIQPIEKIVDWLK